jgi:hypothetical protein
MKLLHSVVVASLTVGRRNDALEPAHEEAHAEAGEKVVGMLINPAPCFDRLSLRRAQQSGFPSEHL